MTPSLLHQFWHVIQEIQAQINFEQDDRDLIEQLIGLLEQKRPLSVEESHLVRTYLSSKTSLIRDLAI